MKRRSVSAFDLKVRGGGIALVLLATALLAALPAHHRTPARPPELVELCMAFVAVCAGSIGASLMCVGCQMFEPVPTPRARVWREDGEIQPLSAATTSSIAPRTST